MSSKQEQVQEAKPQGPQTIYVDASGQIAGRLCSKIAASLLAGNRVTVLNSEKAVISGRRDTVFRLWKERLEIYSHVNPIYGPIHPRKPDNILHRMVRGMVPKEKAKGTAAMGRLRVFIGVPEKYSGVKMVKFDDALARRPLPLYVTLAEVSKSIGWSG